MRTECGTSRWAEANPLRQADAEMDKFFAEQEALQDEARCAATRACPNTNQKQKCKTEKNVKIIQI